MKTGELIFKDDAISTVCRDECGCDWCGDDCRMITALRRLPEVNIKVTLSCIYGKTNSNQSMGQESE